MKRKSLALIMLSLLLAVGAPAQGYVYFSANFKSIWNDFTTPGAGVVSGNETTETFLWTTNLSATVPWTATATNATSSSATWSQVINALASGWSLATNQTTGAEVDSPTSVVGSFKGGIKYASASSFPVRSVPVTSWIDIVLVVWNSSGGSTLAQAEGAADLGVSSVFQYFTGANSSSPVQTFTSAGMSPLGVAPVVVSVGAPEPAVLALLGTGAGALLALRRRSSGK